MTAAVAGAALLAGCAAPAHWTTLRRAPAHTQATAVGRVDGRPYLLLSRPGGQVFVAVAGQPAQAVPDNNPAVATEEAPYTPAVAEGGSLFVATTAGVVRYAVQTGRFSAPLQIARGTPPLGIGATAHAVVFDEMATLDPTTRTDTGPAKLLVVQGGALRSLSLPHGLRPLPLPLAATADSVWLLAAPEPPVQTTLLRYSPASGRLTSVTHFARGILPLAIGPGPHGPAVLLRGTRGHVRLWLAGRRIRLHLKAAETAAAAISSINLAVWGHTLFLGLPSLPTPAGGVADVASLWHIDLRTGRGVRLALPPARNAYETAPVMTLQPGGVLVGFRDAYASQR